MKFDFVIGNPPYQESTSVNNRASAIYPFFYDAAEAVADKYLIISPARFLFDAGLTSTEWNRKMLSDKHIKVEYYNQNSADVFANTDIKGGVAIVYRDSLQDFGAISEFIPDENLRLLAQHFRNISTGNLSSIMFGGRSDLKFNDLFLSKYPNAKRDRLKAIQSKHPDVVKLATNEEYELKSPAFETLPYVFYENEPAEKEKYYKILGLVGGKRTYRWIECEYMTPRYADNNIDYYKVFIPKAIGSGQFGETFSELVCAAPGTSSTPTFISLGKFTTEIEARNAIKYLKSKFSRALLGILKITQDIVPSKCAYIPLQDFTSSSDIDWSKSVAEIDRQLYKKYGLSEAEISFIESKVKEME